MQPHCCHRHRLFSGAVQLDGAECRPAAVYGDLRRFGHRGAVDHDRLHGNHGRCQPVGGVVCAPFYIAQLFCLQHVAYAALSLASGLFANVYFIIVLRAFQALPARR